MSRIKIVMAKHVGCDKKYIFAVPPCMTVCRGDSILVDTIRGRQYAVAVTDEIEINSQDAELLGAYWPIRYVQERASVELANLIKNNSYADMFRDAINGMGVVLPF